MTYDDKKGIRYSSMCAICYRKKNDAAWEKTLSDISKKNVR